MKPSSPERWVENYADVLYRYAVARVGRSHVAEDLVQETFLAALKGRQQFRGDAQERTWLIGILRHKIFDHFRQSKTRREQSLGEETDEGSVDAWFDAQGRWLKPPGSWVPDAPTLLENEEFWQTFHSCLGGLAERPRQIFTLKVMDECRTEEICKEMSLTSTNLWVILHRARVLLRACLEKSWFADDPKAAD